MPSACEPLQTLLCQRRESFVPATVDPRASRVVHFPDLNACPLRDEKVDCQAVHLGYAIPVNVVPLSERPNFVQLELDPTAELTAVSYLIAQNHPFFADRMAATAKHELRSQYPHGENSGDEDIAAIAKQISDHAEAIYQSWKSRGLAPSEILKCHATSNMDSKFSSTSSNVKDLLVQSPDHLEKLVSDFVVEDKARIAAAAATSNKNMKHLPSSIQFALQKFENNILQNANDHKSVYGSQLRNQKAPANSFLNSNASAFTDKIALKTRPLRNRNQIFVETIEPQNFGVNNNKKETNNQNPVVTQVGAWPLKNKLLNKTSNGIVDGKDDGCTVDSSYMDLVAREEKRLIDALKTGLVLAVDNHDKTQELEPNKSLITSKEKLKFEDRGMVKNLAMKSLVTVKEKVQKDVDEVDSCKVVKDEKDFVSSRWGPRVNAVKPKVEVVPHPELTVQQKQNIRSAAISSSGTFSNPVRPFLTRGSVAERVMIFEKCPSELFLDKRSPRQTGRNWVNNVESENKLQVSTDSKESSKPILPPHTTLQRHVKSNKSVHIPRFYFPRGKPALHSQIENTIARITGAFQSLPNHQATKGQFHTITAACELPLYWKVPLFLAVNGDQKGYVEMNTFLDYWKELVKTHHDAASKFIKICTKGARECIYPEDLFPLVQDVVETHPGLTFLKEATEFHSRYVHTVIARIFYCVNRSWSGKITLSELRRSNFLSVISILDHEEDINQVTNYFSYEHFYVIYCKFWELDRDHDLFIDKADLTRHNDYALSSRIIDRIFSGAVSRGINTNRKQESENKMSYTEFVWFLLSEEDKNHPTAIEYWFRCMDLDGDGYLSMYELEYFYEEQLHRMEVIAIETLPFEDCLCQMLDMIHPAVPGKISLSDLKRCKMTAIFFDTFFNVEKYLDHEQRDPFASARDHDADGHELSDWDRFAAEEYELLVAEESGNEQNDNSLYQPSNDSYSSNADVDPAEPEQTNESEYADRTSSMNHQKIAHYDSGDSDDYAESDE